MPKKYTVTFEIVDHTTPTTAELVFGKEQLTHTKEIQLFLIGCLEKSNEGSLSLTNLTFEETPNA